ncbi:NADH:flavin oxidoreductase/NADH oxidase [Phreatobacter sp. AB_2022a]|uniref:NADH:flavin oxidoreductase/NADH oxidase n=1 Tax=Phreatobacter sp. AB_2022a TaxID=3003134 RepID=UPI00228723F2|nr:NADH:flavin oxidoreductase/NADH oxidase [Phreatobacter sp. AB_2022a]MCZ0733836.1 NADH:flavin oxidoreductase/NADH oxidase [Phreatobacter sp. AB_2022a]
MSSDGTPPALPRLLTPLALRGRTLASRIVISPMCQHAADDGHATDWHLVHLGKFALGGAGLILTESTAVARQARIGVRDLGLWSDTHVAPMRRVVDFVHGQGSLIGVQLAHAGRKAGSHALWDGGRAFSPDELAGGGLRRFGPSALAAGPDWTTPEEMTPDDIAQAIDAFVAATHRAERAGFDAVELHFGHGYLVASFLSPVSNRRADGYGGDLDGRMRFGLEVAAAVRTAWPGERPLFCRISAVDGAEGGWGLADSIAFARELKRRGVDVVDVSSGGLTEETRTIAVPRGLGFQVDFARAVRSGAGIITQAVGMIVDAPQAEEVLASGAADLVAIGREALNDPYWPRRAREALGLEPDFSTWPVRHGAWLDKRRHHMGVAMDERRAQLRRAGSET